MTVEITEPPRYWVGANPVHTDQPVVALPHATLELDVFSPGQSIEWVKLVHNTVEVTLLPEGTAFTHDDLDLDQFLGPVNVSRDGIISLPDPLITGSGEDHYAFTYGRTLHFFLDPGYEDPPYVCYVFPDFAGRELTQSMTQISGDRPGTVTLPDRYAIPDPWLTETGDDSAILEARVSEGEVFDLYHDEVIPLDQV